jgi:hypothetical protein
MKLRLLTIVMASFLFFSCKEKQKSGADGEKEGKEMNNTTDAVNSGIGPIPVEDTSDRYFSIKEYFEDHWGNRRQNPYTLLKVVKHNQKVDSSFVPLDDNKFQIVIAPFVAADISDKQFLGWYKFSDFTEDITSRIHYYYEAVKPELFLQKMDVSLDEFTKLIKGVYLETRREVNGEIYTQKLDYTADQLFRLQDFATDTKGNTETYIVEYWFNY